MSSDQFLCEPELRLQAIERVNEVYNKNLERRLENIEKLIERLEKRLWLTVYGVLAVILAQAFRSFIGSLPI